MKQRWAGHGFQPAGPAGPRGTGPAGSNFLNFFGIFGARVLFKIRAGEAGLEIVIVCGARAGRGWIWTGAGGYRISAGNDEGP